jgi:ubiquinone/menaquinone biosynthesis C-methylase UbiE
MATPSRYLLDNSDSIAEHRMKALARLYDSASQRALTTAGIAPGWHCLEIGGGGGGIARWMAERVGVLGSVLCTDLDPRHIAPSELPNLHVVRHDAVHDELPEGKFDLAHARLVLVHIPERAAVLEKMVAALKPGGWLLIEDFDATSVLPDAAANPQERRVETAEAQRTYMIRGGVDPRFGRSLYGRFKGLGLTEVSAEGRVTMWDGANGGADLMRINFEQIGAKVVAAGLLSTEQLKDDLKRLDDPGFVTPSPIMWAALGRKPLAADHR